MAHHPFVVVDDAPPVAGEQTARRNCVQVTPWIHPVATRHAQSLARRGVYYIDVCARIATRGTQFFGTPSAERPDSGMVIRIQYT